MKTIGIIGGMSPESTVSYYQIINRETNARLGGNHSADIVMHSIDFETIVRLQKVGDWAGAGRILAASARKLESMGADVLVLATNTMHKIADAIQSAVGIPLLHVVDTTAQAVKAQGLNTVGLLGTRFTMSDGFYTERMKQHGIETLVPADTQQHTVHRIIFEELCLNRFEPAAKRAYLDIIACLKEQGAQGVIFGCTEIGLLLKQQDCPIPVFDSAEIHALAAVDYALG
ncbi:aspartate/glutamate racemase family protein [Neisseria wadsworthii]|uniref:Aspartate racemase n=1 Tax=Neisseria wadsworthii 9715 TaxID=1030841 RepID=G4CNU0_9NEIS|nr:aspartate/glutamate racemase family protein [Neisseria wadsworthii]EGZ48890.1 aspartate racemase [Neisseria wadsworthii 9715]QMT36698.1 aspartate/glutamate racemase family protein [Neisseria wadsworthii]